MAPSRRVGKQFTADQHAADFARACSNLIELGVAPQATRRILIDVAVAAERLDRFSGHPGRLLSGIKNGSGRVLAERAGMIRAVAGLADRIDIGPAGLPGGVHVGDLALHKLKLAYGLAELLAVVHIGDDDIHAGRHDAERAARQNGSLVVKAAHQDPDTVTHLPQDALGWNLPILEEHQVGALAPPPDLVALAPEPPTPEPLLDVAAPVPPVLNLV